MTQKHRNLIQMASFSKAFLILFIYLFLDGIGFVVLI